VTPAPVNARHSSASVEHYTPPDVVEAARVTLGGIDLDPASCELANRTVRAQRIYTSTDDGLAREWRGRVFLNPPGGKDGDESVQKLWWFKLVREWMAGRATSAIFVAFSIEILQTSQIDSKGPIPLDFPICFPRSRVKYSRAAEPTGTPMFPAIGEPELLSGSSPPHASCIVLLPPRGSRTVVQRFATNFAVIGRCVGLGSTAATRLVGR
jgi:hypothetical protein